MKGIKLGIKEEFGEKVKRMRQNRGLTQEQLAEAIDISQRALSAIERGENFVTSETIDKLLKTLNTTTEDLFALNHLKTPEELFDDINNNLSKIINNPQKLEIVYNVTKALLKE